MASDATLALLDPLLRQLEARLASDAAVALDWKRSVDERFAAVHEDARRDRRELYARIDRLADDVGKIIGAGLEALKAEIADVCDRGGKDHGAMKAETSAVAEQVRELIAWRDAQLHQATGRAQVKEGQKGAVAFIGQNIVPIVCLVVTLLGLIKDQVPTITIGPSQAQRTAASTFR